MKGKTQMHKNENEIGDLSANKIESIEDLLRMRGFFNSADGENKKKEEVLASAPAQKFAVA